MLRSSDRIYLVVTTHWLSVVNREKFNHEARAAYEAVLLHPATRLCTWVWPRWIPLDRNADAFDRFRWLEERLSQSKLPALIIWAREDDVFDAAVFSERLKQILPHAEGPYLVTGRHFLQQDSGPEIAARIVALLDRLDRRRRRDDNCYRRRKAGPEREALGVCRTILAKPLQRASKQLSHREVNFAAASARSAE
jgi:hypothetical protein